MIKYFLIFISFIFSVQTAADLHLSKIDVKNNLGNSISQDIEIINDKDEKVLLSHFFNDDIPVIIVMAYYQCPMLCSLVLNGLSQSLSETDLIPGDDYKLLTISIDPREDSSLAKDKKNNYLENYFKDSESKDFWTFSTSTQENINKITNELGFVYSYDEKSNQYAHPAVVYVLNGDGIISKQIFGINPTSNDIELSVISARNNEISSIFDKILLYCYRYDPKAGSYTILASNVMKIAGASTVFAMAGFLSFFWIKERII